SIQRNALTDAAPHRGLQPMIRGGTAIIRCGNGREILSILRTGQDKWPPLVDIAGGRAGRIAAAVDYARRPRKIDARITFFGDPHMNGMCTNIRSRDKPFGTNLFFETEVPLV